MFYNEDVEKLELYVKNLETVIKWLKKKNINFEISSRGNDGYEFTFKDFTNISSMVEVRVKSNSRLSSSGIRELDYNKFYEVITEDLLDDLYEIMYYHKIMKELENKIKDIIELKRINSNLINVEELKKIINKRRDYVEKINIVYKKYGMKINVDIYKKMVV